MAHPARSRRLTCILAASTTLAGCSFVPKSRLDECHIQSQGMRTENAQLKDVTLDLRSHNQDLTQRSLDDAHRVEELEAANRRLVQSVLAYQEEREQMIAAFERFRGALSASAQSTRPEPR